jgi:Cytochrome c7 and related cytochrome c
VSVLAAVKVFAILLVVACALAAQQPASSPAAQQIVPNSYGNHPAPAQPLPYNHKTHVSRGLQCQFCHTNPDPGALMTFPAAKLCMGCHATLAKNKPAIRQLAAFANSGKPIPWVRVYVVTPGVTWTHRKHLEAGMKCENCHGQVAQMDAMSETTSVAAMGVCINCHAQNKAPTTCQTCHAWPAN